MTDRATLRERRARETRQLILDAAYGIFARHGYGQASVDHILAEAGISKGAFYHYFASKEELFRTILIEHVRRRTAETASRLEPDLPLREGMLRILGASWETCRADPIWSALFVEFWALATRNEWGRQAVAELFDHCATALARFLSNAQRGGLVRGNLDVYVAARLLLAVNDGLMLQWQVDPGKVDPEEFLGPTADMIMGYLTAGGPAASEATPRRRGEALT